MEYDAPCVATTDEMDMLLQNGHAAVCKVFRSEDKCINYNDCQFVYDCQLMYDIYPNCTMTFDAPLGPHFELPSSIFTRDNPLCLSGMFWMEIDMSVNVEYTGVKLRNTERRILRDLLLGNHKGCDIGGLMYMGGHMFPRTILEHHTGETIPRWRLIMDI